MEMHRDMVWVAPHPHVVDENQGGYLRSEGSYPTLDHPDQGFSAREISPNNFWLLKPVRVGVMEEIHRIFRHLLLKGLQWT